MTAPSRLATTLRATLAAALVAFALPVFANCDNKNCDRTADGLGRSVKVAPAPQPRPIVKQPWAVAQSTSEMTIIIDPYGNVFTGTSRATPDRPVFRLNLQRINMQTGQPVTAAPGKPLPKLQARHYSVALSGTNGEFAVIADNHGNVYSGAIRPRVDIASLAQALGAAGGRCKSDDSSYCE